MRTITVFGLLALFLMAGCSGSGSGTGAQALVIEGKWSAVATSGKYFDNGGPLMGYIELNVHQTGSRVYSTQEQTIVVARCSDNTETVDGTISGNRVVLTLLEGGERVTLNGTISADKKSITGTYTAASGGCLSGDSGTWTAQFFEDIAGAYAGTINSDIWPLPIPIGVSASLQEDSAYNLTGTGVLTNWTCFNNVQLTGGSIGSMFVVLDGSSQLVLVGQLADSAGTRVDSLTYAVVGGPCSGDAGSGSLAKSTQAAQNLKKVQPKGARVNPAVTALLARTKQQLAKRK